MRIRNVLIFALFAACITIAGHAVTTKSHSESAFGANWLSGWTYRQAHTILGSSVGSQVNYPLAFTVHYDSGTDYQGDVYLSGKCRTDFGDIRFTDSSGSNQLDYWIQEKVDGNYAVIWAEISYIPTSPGNTTIYIYYGNPNAATTSNGDSTFLAFDDFEGSSINTTRWTIEGTVTTSTNHAFTGTQSMKHDAGANFLKLNTLPQSGNVRVAVYCYDLMSANKYEETALLADDPTAPGLARAVGVYEELSIGNYMYRISSYWNVGSEMRTNSWHRFEIEHTSNDYFWIDGVEQTNVGAASAVGRIYVGGLWYEATEVGYYDTFFIRKCVRPEPTHGVWGVEEKSDAIPPQIILVQWAPTCPYPFVPSLVPRKFEPVLLTANVTDEVGGSGVGSVRLMYRVNGSALCNVTMTYNGSTKLYNCIIPGQPGGSNVTLHVQATDNAGNTNTSQPYSYLVKWLFPTDINGDGKVDIEDLARTSADFAKHYP